MAKVAKRTPVLEHNIMIDIETLGVTETAHILSIGLCSFSLVEGVRNVDGRWEFQLGLTEQNRSIDAGTLNFWLRQPAETFAKVTKVDLKLKDALEMLVDIITCHKCDGSNKVNLWCNGANFDFLILKDAFAQHDIPTPWAYYEENCMRAIKVLVGANYDQLCDMVNHRMSAKGITMVPHEALSDALWQAEFVAAANSYLL